MTDVTSGKCDNSDLCAGSPIIFVPGIFDSRLYNTDGKLVWLSPMIKENVLKYLDIDNPLIVQNNLIDQCRLPIISREYGLNNAFLFIISVLCDEFKSSNVFVFSYDFRRSCSDAADALRDESEYILENYDCDKVNIVAHSMGGLVASSYAAKYGTSDIDKVITLAAPYEGSPKAFYSAASGNIHGIPEFLTEQAGLSRSMYLKYPSLSELLPTKRFIEKYPLKAGSEDVSFEEYENICRKLVGDNYDRGVDFMNSINKNGRNILTYYDKSYFLAGIGRQTAVSVKMDGDAVYEIKEGNDDIIKGDSLVPFDSASMMGELEKLGKDEFGDDRFVYFENSHNGLLRSPKVLRRIINILKK